MAAKWTGEMVKDVMLQELGRRQMGQDERITALEQLVTTQSAVITALEKRLNAHAAAYYRRMLGDSYMPGGANYEPDPRD